MQRPDQADPWFPRIGQPIVQAPAIYVKGFPFLVAMTLHIEPTDGGINDLPCPYLSELADAVGLLVDDRTGRRWREIVPAPNPDASHNVAVFDLGPHQRRHLLLDLAALMEEGHGLPDDSYTLTLVYCTGRDAPALAAPRGVTVRQPTAREQDELVELSAELDQAESWDAWMKLPADDPQRLTGPFRADDPLLYHRVVRYLQRGPRELRDADPAPIDLLPSHLMAEATLLRVELARERGDQARVAQLADYLRDHFPGTSEELAAILAGDGPLAFVRNQP